MTRSPSASTTLLPARHGLPYRILFVCTGNICRSPMAEVITRALAEATALPDPEPHPDQSTLGSHLELTSAGTGPWHDGEPMHDNTAAALARGGFPQHPHIARQVMSARLADYDLVVALDRRHLQTLRGLGADPERLVLLRAFDDATGAAVDVPDPYYGDATVFDQCRDLIEAACQGLVTALATNWETIAKS